VTLVEHAHYLHGPMLKQPWKCDGLFPRVGRNVLPLIAPYLILKEKTVVHAAKRNPDRCPSHPGALLREDVIPATGRTKAEIAQLLGISRQHLYDILRERKPVSPVMAVRLGKLFGDGAGVWVRMQAAYDTWHAERKEDVSRIPTLRGNAA
jgi:antitoxin HigA-1